MVRMRAEQFEQLDGWIAQQSDPKPTRPEAIRRLIDAGLRVSEPIPIKSTAPGVGTGCARVRKAKPRV